MATDARCVNKMAVVSLVTSEVMKRDGTRKSKTVLRKNYTPKDTYFIMLKLLKIADAFQSSGSRHYVFREHLQGLKEERQRLEKEQKRQHDRMVQRERNERNERDWERLKRTQRARAKEEAEAEKKEVSRSGMCLYSVNAGTSFLKQNIQVSI